MKHKASPLIATFIYLLLLKHSDGYRVLGVFVFPVYSHYFLGSSLLKGLAEAGHDITMISPFSQDSFPENSTWKEIVLHDIRATYQRNSNMMKLNEMSFLEQWTKYIQLYKYITETTLSNPEIQNLIHSDEKFDVVIVSEMVMDSMKAFAAHFDAHLIFFSNYAGFNFYFSDLNLPSLPSHFPETFFTGSHGGKLHFLDRIRNIYLWAIRIALVKFYEAYHQADLVKKYFPGIPDLRDIKRNTSLVLVNSHSGLNYQQPKISMMVDIGGFHLKPPKKLPDNLQTILDNARNGVIYFSMGSNIKSEHLTKDQIEVFLKVFAERKELILWKFSKSSLPGKPDNVILTDWFPQQDILAHPGINLFITHGGFLSLTETIYYGVPVISIPLAIDQKQNALFLVDNGLGLTINLEDITEEILNSSIEEVTSNPKYAKAAKDRSLILRDRVKSPMKEAIYWVEYVVRHSGANHLKVPYLGMPWYQFYLLDIIGTFMIGIIVVMWLTKKYVLMCFGLFNNFKKLKTH